MNGNWMFWRDIDLIAVVLGAVVPAPGLDAHHIRGLGMDHLDFQTVVPDAREDIVFIGLT